MNRSLLFIIGALLITAGCSDGGPASVDPGSKEYPLQSIDPIPFTTEALAADEMQVVISREEVPETYRSGELALVRNTDTLATSSITPDDRSLTATLSHKFDRESYSLAVSLQSYSRDTIYTYQLEEYTYRYEDGIDVQPLVSFEDTPSNIDLTPDEQYIFWSEIDNTYGDGPVVNEEPTLLRYDRSSGEKVIIDDDFSGWNLIRARSDDKVITVNYMYEGRTLQGDSLALVEYDTETRTEKLLTFVSSSYGRFTHIIDDKMIVTRPYLSDPPAYVIDLQNDTIRDLEVDFRYILESPRQFLGVGTKRYDFERDELVAISNWLKADTKRTTWQYDPSDQTLVMVEYIREGSGIDAPYRTKLNVYRGEEQLFSEDEYQHKSVDWAFYQPGNDRVLFYQQFYPSLSPRPSGVYQLDLTTGSITLVDNVSGKRIPYHVLQTEEGDLLGKDREGIVRLTYRGIDS